MSQREEFQRTIGYGEAAIGQLRRNEIPAYPRNYELWYTYCAGFNHALNKAVNDILRARGHISADEVHDIYSQFLAPSRLGDRIEEVGTRLSDEINDVVNAMEQTISANARYCDSLSASTTELLGTTDQKRVLSIVQGLITATRSSEATNRLLESQLGESRKQIADLQESLDAIRFESLTDELTTLANRKHFDQSIERAVANARESNETFSMLITDIDHFKTFNDTYGHQTGDQVLRLVGLAVKQNVKGQDIACRYGGEEFAIILPRTGLDHARTVADHIRIAVMSKELVKRSTGENLGYITISIGVSTWKPTDSVASVIERADAALYLAKRNGRNRVCTERDLAVMERRQPGRVA
ncbi:GGDEF domain-containing protein [Chthonobacter rhizosphaerae]|uniref:GGDEF domain-containing protein n=1 Tax=Chthonobacter rhizosphaerae TaxID=2735553 RepID=UPI0015EF37E3|nr:GGDEF domain-containing protein [Chthonobacter rhizosphaerae]